MKRSACLFLALMCLLPAGFLSCDQNNGKALVGRWETETTDDALGTLSIVYNFTKDGKIYVEQEQGDTIPFSIPFGDWWVEGDKLTIKSGREENTFTFSVKDSVLSLVPTEGETVEFRRISE